MSNHVNLVYLLSAPFGSFQSFHILSALYSLLPRFSAFFCLLIGPTFYLGTHGPKVGPNPWVGFSEVGPNPWVGYTWVPTKTQGPIAQPTNESKENKSFQIKYLQ